MYVFIDFDANKYIDIEKMYEDKVSDENMNYEDTFEDRMISYDEIYGDENRRYEEKNGNEKRSLEEASGESYGKISGDEYRQYFDIFYGPVSVSLYVFGGVIMTISAIFLPMFSLYVLAQWSPERNSVTL